MHLALAPVHSRAYLGRGPRDGLGRARAARRVRGLAVATAVGAARRDVRRHTLTLTLTLTLALSPNPKPNPNPLYLKVRSSCEDDSE